MKERLNVVPRCNNLRPELLLLLNAGMPTRPGGGRNARPQALSRRYDANDSPDAARSDAQLPTLPGSSRRASTREENFAEFEN